MFGINEYNEFSIERLNEEVTITTGDLQKTVYQSLKYRKNGRGRCLQKRIGELDLCKGARLEPSTSLPDVASFEYQECPFNCIFYTGSKDNRVLHLSPLLKIPGFNVSSWCIDLLHTWHFGPLSTFITHSIRALLATPIWKPAIAGLDKEENEKLALLALKAELWTHYKARRETDAEWRVKGSEVGGLDT